MSGTIVFFAGKKGRTWRVFPVREGQSVQVRAAEEGIVGRTRTAWPEEVARWKREHPSTPLLPVGRSAWAEVVDDVAARALELYRAPFKYVRGYFYDAEGYTIADEVVDGSSAEGAPTCRTRGWGRILYLPRPRELQDAVTAHIAAALDGLTASGDKDADGANVAEALTRYWEGKAK